MKSKILIAAAALALVTGCNEPDDGSYVAPITLYEKMDGQWSLTDLKMVDEVAKAAGIEPNAQNLTSSFNYADFKISFNLDATGQPSNYEVLGDVPPLFEPTGYWALAYPYQQTNGGPATIYLFADAAHTQKTDELLLTAVPGSNHAMELQLVRKSGGTAFVSYTFKLNAAAQ